MVKTVLPENVNVITGNVNEVFDKCHDKLLDIINKHSPIRKREVSEKKPQERTMVNPQYT